MFGHLPSISYSTAHQQCARTSCRSRHLLQRPGLIHECYLWNQLPSDLCLHRIVLTEFQNMQKSYRVIVRIFAVRSNFTIWSDLSILSGCGLLMYDKSFSILFLVSSTVDRRRDYTFPNPTIPTSKENKIYTYEGVHRIDVPT